MDAQFTTIGALAGLAVAIVLIIRKVQPAYSLILGAASTLISAVIGTLGAVGLSKIRWKSKGALEYVSILPLMIPEIILGMVLMAFFYMMKLPFGMLTLLIGIGIVIFTKDNTLPRDIGMLTVILSVVTAAICQIILWIGRHRR